MNKAEYLKTKRSFETITDDKQYQLFLDKRNFIITLIYLIKIFLSCSEEKSERVFI